MEAGMSHEAASLPTLGTCASALVAVQGQAIHQCASRWQAQAQNCFITGTASLALQAYGPEASAVSVHPVL